MVKNFCGFNLIVQMRSRIAVLEEVKPLLDVIDNFQISCHSEYILGAGGLQTALVFQIIFESRHPFLVGYLLEATLPQVGSMPVSIRTICQDKSQRYFF